MDFSRQIEDNRRALITDVVRRLEEQLAPFHYALDAFLAQLFKAVIPHDWREKFHAFIAEQEAKGFTIAESSVSELEAWIEAWAKDCKLWPEEMVEQFAEDEIDDESESTFIISVVPDVSGPHRSKKSAAKMVGTTNTNTRPRTPSDKRGTWIEGTKGDGVFKYNQSPKNVADGVAGMEVRFEKGFIAEKGLPKSIYYRGDPELASVELDDPKGTNADNVAADAKMRETLGDPNWQRPDDYVWNHAGAPGSRMVELVKRAIHEIIAHKSFVAEIRQAFRSAGSPRAIGRAFNILDVYLTVRDALQYLGVLEPTYEEAVRMTYTFEADDGSLFVVWPGRIWGGTIEFVDGSRKGETESIPTAEVNRLRGEAEKIWGRYIPGTYFQKPRFIPGTKRSSILYYETDAHGLVREAGWIDEHGTHSYGVPKLPIY